MSRATKTPDPVDGTVSEATNRACAHCPWRLANQGRRHPHGFYTRRNLRFLWSRLRRGERMTCHPTDARMAEFPGYEETAGRDARECAGALILQQREMMRFQAECERADAAGEPGAGWLYYRHRFGLGMTREGLAEILARAIFGGSARDRLRMARPNLGDLEVGFPPLGTWTNDEPGAQLAMRRDRSSA